MIKNIIDILKNLWGQGVIKILTLVILIIVAISIWSTTNKSTTVNNKISYDQPIPGTQKAPENLNVVFQLKKEMDIPKSLPIYKINQSGEDVTLAFFNNITKKLNISGTPNVRSGEKFKIYTLSNNRGVFQGNVLVGNFSYIGNITSGLSFKTEAEARLSAKIFLTSAGIQTNNTLSETTTAFYRHSGMEILPVLNINEADSVRVQFWQKVDKYKIVPLGIFSGINLLADIKSGEIQEINFSPANIDEKKQSIFNTISFEDLKNNRLRQIYSTELTSSGYQMRLANIQEGKQLTVNSFNIVYVASPEDLLNLKPVYEIGGIIEFGNGKRANFSGYIPAIKPN